MFDHYAAFTLYALAVVVPVVWIAAKVVEARRALRNAPWPDATHHAMRDQLDADAASFWRACECEDGQCIACELERAASMKRHPSGGAR